MSKLTNEEWDSCITDAGYKINHPDHYQGNDLEAIDVIESFGLGFCLGNVIKYVLRAVHFFSECGFVRQEVIHEKTLLTICVPEFYIKINKLSEPQSEPQVNQK